MRIPQVGLLLVASLLDITLGWYHLTHSGTVSGVLQLAALVPLLAVLLTGSRGAASIWALAAITAVGILFLVLGVYHLTRPDGLPSGILELTTLGLLIAWLWIARRRDKRL